jgi:Fic family protein
MYIWQREDWQQGDMPAFHWQTEKLLPQLEAVRLQQGRLLGKSEAIVNIPNNDGDEQASELQAAQLDALVQNALRTSEIEGETLNVASVRSSVINTLGLASAGLIDSAGLIKGTPQTDALAKLLVEATTQSQTPLSLQTLCQWQAALFPEPSQFVELGIGQLRGDAPMQVVSGRLDRPNVHFEVPPRQTLEAELQRFIHWFNHPTKGLDMLLRAGIAHLWLITLHPFDDGNGRVTRALTDRALAQAEHNSIRYYSHSAAIMARRSEYYRMLEETQKGSLDITPWLSWFLEVLNDALNQGLSRFDRVLTKTRFWQQHSQTVLNQRQIKVLNRLLDTQGKEFLEGINASKYRSLANVSKATATRELADLVQKNCLSKLPGGGRSTRYALGE